MKLLETLLLAPLVAAVPLDILDLPPELAARRANITERVPYPDELQERQASASINNLIRNKGKVYFGTCTDRGLLTSGKNAAIIQANLGQVTPENSMLVPQSSMTPFVRIRGGPAHEIASTPLVF